MYGAEKDPDHQVPTTLWENSMSTKRSDLQGCVGVLQPARALKFVLAVIVLRAGEKLH